MYATFEFIKPTRRVPTSRPCLIWSSNAAIMSDVGATPITS